MTYRWTLREILKSAWIIIRRKPDNSDLRNRVEEALIQGSELINMQDEEIKRLQRHCDLLEALVASSYKPPQDTIDAVLENNKKLLNQKKVH